MLPVLPLSARIESILAGEIADGTFPVGVRLPNETDLIERFSVTRIIIRQAMRGLVRKGLVEVRRGIGTFVLPDGPEIAKLPIGALTSVDVVRRPS